MEQYASIDKPVRVDKWLWAARFFKTRTIAQDNIELGRVKIGGQRVKPGKELKIGDVLEISRAGEHFVVVVTGLSGIRGNATAASKLYKETEESFNKRMQIKEISKLVPIPGSELKGRPTKRDGRKIRDFMKDFDPSRDI